MSPSYRNPFTMWNPLVLPLKISTFGFGSKGRPFSKDS